MGSQSHRNKFREFIGKYASTVELFAFGCLSRRSFRNGSYSGFGSNVIYGMSIMSDSVGQLSEVPEFIGILTAFLNSILGVFCRHIIYSRNSVIFNIGRCFASVFNEWHNDFGVAIPMVMGQNIGTCVSTLIASIGTKKCKTSRSCSCAVQYLKNNNLSCNLVDL